RFPHLGDEAQRLLRIPRLDERVGHLDLGLLRALLRLPGCGAVVRHLRSAVGAREREFVGVSGREEREEEEHRTYFGCCTYCRNTCTIAGPSRLANSDGMMKRIMTTVSFGEICAAFSSALSWRFVRTRSACTRSARATLVPNRSACARTFTSCFMSSRPVR